MSLLYAILFLRIPAATVAM